jgi:hypothetical protein
MIPPTSAQAAASGTPLDVTTQVASLAGEGLIEGHEQGHRTGLAKLFSFLSRLANANKASVPAGWQKG